MKLSAIEEAKENAERFLRAVEALDLRMKVDPDMRRFFGICGFKETGAVRRASLDLTRSLAEMRKP